MLPRYDIAVLGGGAAGFFSAISAKSTNKHLKVAIFEKQRDVLQKVRVSGGGRCNVTHACFDPHELVNHYPRGNKALLGPFHKFGPGDTMMWFEERGVPLKIEEDGRVFPESNSSLSIIECLLHETQRLGIEVLTLKNVKALRPVAQGWTLLFADNTKTSCQALMIASGSVPSTWQMLRAIDLELIEPVPSLFTFNIKDPRIAGLMGISLPNAKLGIPDLGLEAEGPLLITHWGLSGPAILRLSAWGARALHDCNYACTLLINYLHLEPADIQEMMLSYRQMQGAKHIGKYPLEGVPMRLWEKLLSHVGVDPQTPWAHLRKQDEVLIISELIGGSYKVRGKSTFKEEFVTAGGVNLNEIDFKHFRSKKFHNLYLAGEVLDIDAITGGFNFQSAWTGGHIAGESMALSMV